MLERKDSQRYDTGPPAEQQLADTRHAFEEFAYTVAHDLSAPLRCIASFLQLLEERYNDVLDEKALHYVDLIADNSRKAQARIAALLQYSRLDTVPLQLELVDFRQVIGVCMKQLHAEIEDRATVKMGALPKITADRERLSLLFYCLLSNALKFGGERPQVEIDAGRYDGGWQFSVRDNGIGIDARDQEAIFKVFHRLHNDHEYPGCGMGLTLARRIAELHGGTVRVASQPGRGATFYVTLPDRIAEPSGTA